MTKKERITDALAEFDFDALREQLNEDNDGFDGEVDVSRLPLKGDCKAMLNTVAAMPPDSFVEHRRWNILALHSTDGELKLVYYSPFI